MLEEPKPLRRMSLYTRRLQQCVPSALALSLLLALVNAAKLAQARPQPSLSASSTTESACQPATMTALVQRARTAWMKGDAQAFASLFTSKGEFVVPGNRWVGPAAIRQVAADFAANTPQVTITIHRLLVEGSQAAVEWHWEETDATGQRHRADDVIMVTCVAGKISRWREYIDTQTPQPD
jgi:uncharacterized protein (TIGR02246 family)